MKRVTGTKNIKIVFLYLLLMFLYFEVIKYSDYTMKG